MLASNRRGRVFVLLVVCHFLSSASPAAAISECGAPAGPLFGIEVFSGEAFGSGVPGAANPDGSLNVVVIEVDEVLSVEDWIDDPVRVGDRYELSSSERELCFGERVDFDDGSRYLVGVAGDSVEAEKLASYRGTIGFGAAALALAVAAVAWLRRKPSAVGGHPVGGEVDERAHWEEAGRADAE